MQYQTAQLRGATDGCTLTFEEEKGWGLRAWERG